MAVELRSLTWHGVDEDHARANASVFLAYKLVRERVAWELVLPEKPNAQPCRVYRRGEASLFSYRAV